MVKRFPHCFDRRPRVVVEGAVLIEPSDNHVQPSFANLIIRPALPAGSILERERERSAVMVKGRRKNLHSQPIIPARQLVSEPSDGSIVEPMILRCPNQISPTQPQPRRDKQRGELWVRLKRNRRGHGSIGTPCSTLRSNWFVMMYWTNPASELRSLPPGRTPTNASSIRGASPASCAPHGAPALGGDRAMARRRTARRLASTCRARERRVPSRHCRSGARRAGPRRDDPSTAQTRPRSSVEPYRSAYLSPG